MNKHQAIYAVAPTTVTIRDDEAFDAAGNPVAYDEAAVQAYIDANVYKELRAKAYPSMADQLDTIYHEGIDAWKATITAVKQEYPKP
jgi:hypothetical protein